VPVLFGIQKIGHIRHRGGLCLIKAPPLLDRLTSYSNSYKTKPTNVDVECCSGTVNSTGSLSTHLQYEDP